MTERQAPAPVVTKREAASRIGVSIRTVDRYIASGQLRVVRPSSRVTRIVEADVDALLTPGSAA